MNRTKNAIISAFEELLDERPLSKITVKDIVDRCSVNRNTFYYYFSDIPALLEETTKNFVDQIIQTCPSLSSPVDCLLPMVQYGTAHKRAILHIYRSVQREIFQTYLDRMATYIVRQYVETATKDFFPSSSHVQERELLIKYYKCTMVGALLDWLDAGMQYDLLAGTASICALLAGSGRQAFLRCLENPKSYDPITP